jgi:hypothetical protein
MTTNSVLRTLKQELEFLDNGGYRTPIGSRQPLFCMETAVGWRQPLFFEDSPSCPKKKYCACNPDGDCVLMSFVPIEQRHQTTPCWHIPLNEKSETVHGLYKTRTNEEIEAALRKWLLKTIKSLEKAIAHEKPA